jgi:hypothetical protein
MTIFQDEDFEDCPFLHRWTITTGDNGCPIITGQHAFHEGVRTCIDEVFVVDPMMRWCIGSHGGYRLTGVRRAAEVAEFGLGRKDQ